MEMQWVLRTMPNSFLKCSIKCEFNLVSFSSLIYCLCKDPELWFRHWVEGGGIHFSCRYILSTTQMLTFNPLISLYSEWREAGTYTNHNDSFDASLKYSEVNWCLHTCAYFSPLSMRRAQTARQMYMSKSGEKPHPIVLSLLLQVELKDWI